jgi:hypothetical protein
LPVTCSLLGSTSNQSLQAARVIMDAINSRENSRFMVDAVKS